MAHAVQEFYNTAWDGLHIELESTSKQRYPSPAYMPDYPKYDDQPPAEFYLGHKDIACASSPCFDGARVDSFNGRNDGSKWIGVVAKAMDVTQLEDDDRFQTCTQGINRDKLISFCTMFKTDKVKCVVVAARRF